MYGKLHAWAKLTKLEKYKDEKYKANKTLLA